MDALNTGSPLERQRRDSKVPSQGVPGRPWFGMSMHRWNQVFDPVSAPHLRALGRPLSSVGLLATLVAALVATLLVLLAPSPALEPKMWPLYGAAAIVLLWVVVGLLRKAHTEPTEEIDTPAEAADTDILVRDLTACPVCHGAGSVCEAHPWLPLQHDDCRAAGRPCACNPEGELR